MSLTLPDTPARVRIAPSPTGDPHVGTAYVALYNKALARKTGGQFLLRIEDTDRKRFFAESERMIFEALDWLELGPDEGPDQGGPVGPYRQSERTEIYRAAVTRLLEGEKAYRCFCTPEDLTAMRAEQKEKKLNFGYDGRCRNLTAEQVQAKVDEGVPHVVRMTIDKAGETTFVDALRGEVTIQHEQVDDQVLLKSDGFPTYHLANVVDDHEMGITHVLRGEEWISSTPKHVLLYEAFGWEPATFCHLPLLRKADKNKSKLSKRKDPVSILWYREQGFLKEALVNFLGLMGYSMPDEREVFSLDEFFEAFDPTRLKRTGPAFDMTKLEWLNGEWIRSLTPDAFIERLHGFFGDRYQGNDELLKKVAPLLQERIKKLNEWPALAGIFFTDALAAYDPNLLTPKKLRDPAQADAVLVDMIEHLSTLEPFTVESVEACCRERAEALGHKIGPFFMVLRVASSGSKVSPPLFESIEAIGKERVLARLEYAREILKAHPKRGG
ncbi:MAG: glutamate--tRNA ligase [Planctomycetota bacterium]